MKLNLDVCIPTKEQFSETACRYLAEEDDGKHICLKLTKDRKIIDKEVAQAIAADEHHNLPIGDNCTGVSNKESWTDWLFKD